MHAIRVIACVLIVLGSQLGFCQSMAIDSLNFYVSRSNCSICNVYMSDILRKTGKEVSTVSIYTDCRNRAEFQRYFGHQAIDLKRVQLILKSELNTTFGEYELFQDGMVIRAPLDYPVLKLLGILSSKKVTPSTPHEYTPSKKSILALQDCGPVLINTDLSAVPARADRCSSLKVQENFERDIQALLKELNEPDNLALIQRSNLPQYEILALVEGPGGEDINITCKVIEGQISNGQLALNYSHFLYYQSAFYAIDRTETGPWSLAPDLYFSNLVWWEGNIIAPVNNYKDDTMAYPALARFELVPPSVSGGKGQLQLQEVIDTGFLIRNYRWNNYMVRPQRSLAIDSGNNQLVFSYQGESKGETGLYLIEASQIALLEPEPGNRFNFSNPGKIKWVTNTHYLMESRTDEEVIYQFKAKNKGVKPFELRFQLDDEDLMIGRVSKGVWHGALTHFQEEFNETQFISLKLPD